MRFEKNDPAPKPTPEDLKGFQPPPGMEPEVLDRSFLERNIDTKIDTGKVVAKEKRNILQTEIGTWAEILSKVDSAPLEAYHLYMGYGDPESDADDIPEEAYVKMWNARAKEDPEAALLEERLIDIDSLTKTAERLAIKDPARFLELTFDFIFDANKDFERPESHSVYIKNYDRLVSIAKNTLKKKDPEAYEEYNKKQKLYE